VHHDVRHHQRQHKVQHAEPEVPRVHLCVQHTSPCN
jgi:hypothetical protein